MIAIKDFKMPENCLKCPMQFGGWCYVSPSDVDERVAPTVDEAWEQGKPDWCPLVDVPDEAGNCSEFPNSSDCVSRQAAIEIVNRYDKSHMVLKQRPMLGAASIVIELEELPSVQPEIIICLDCVHYEPLGKEKAWGRCSVHSSPTDNQRFVQSCDFCAWAERKTDD